MKPEAHQDRNVAVAIIGLAGRFPGARTVAQYWKNLCDGVESLELASKEELLSVGVPQALLDNPSYVRAGGSVEDAEAFDASFFGFGAREAEIIDPQQRVFLECAWEALEDAGCDPRNHPGAIGVFAGAGMNTYGPVNLYSNPSIIESVGHYQLMLGNDKDFLATRVAYKLNLRGPAISVQTACSTSLVAVQMAFESLLRGECDMALAGGVSIQFPQNSGYLYMPGMILSPDGHCRTFDADAAGTVPGRGAGVVVLKLLDDAVRDGDRIYAVVRGAAINNDGAAKVGYSAPSIEGQSQVIRKSMEMAGFEPDSIRYVEAHGTGTEVGDPIEVAALTKAFGDGTGARQYCALGSVKPNIGHLDTAAGVAGLIKASLCLYHRVIPPTLHFRRPNPHIDFAQSPFYVNTTLRSYSESKPFRAGVSSFGIGGTNAHVSLEEWLEPKVQSDGRSQLIVLSARSAEALKVQSASLANHLDQNPALNLAEVAYTLQAGRRAFSHRRFVVARDTQHLHHLLQDSISGGSHGLLNERHAPTLAFLFPGQGSQYVNMGRGLYESNRTFRETIDQCSGFLEPHLGLDLKGILYPSKEQEAEAQELLSQTWITQPALFVVEYATARLWQAVGIEPSAMVGHSVGEYVAACLAGVFKLEDALTLVAARGQLIQSLPSGSMLAVPMSEIEVMALLPNGLSVAAANSRKNTVVSGPKDEIDAFEALLRSKNVTCRRLRTSHAFHSAMMDPALAAFQDQVALVPLNAPSIPYLSNLTGTWVEPLQATDPAYWTRHLRHAVRFADCVDTLSASATTVWLEVGPGDTLRALVQDHLGRDSSLIPIASMRHPLLQKDDRDHWLEAVGQAWQTGVAFQWSELYEAGRPYKTSLPSYPFERERFWVDAVQTPTESPVQKSKGATKNPDISEWFYAQTWKRSLLKPHLSRPVLTDGKVCLLFLDSESSWADDLLVASASTGRVIRVQSAKRFAQISDDLYEIDPAERLHYSALFECLLSNSEWPERIVHAFAFTGPTVQSLEVSIDRGFMSLMYLAQTIADISSTRPVELNVLTHSAYDVYGNGVCKPQQAVLGGICKVIPTEIPNIRCRVIDLSTDQAPSSVRTFRMQLRSEIESEITDRLVILRGKTRWIASYEPIVISAGLPSEIAIPTGAVFLITGGLGGMALVWARYLARTYQARFVLTGRSEFPEPAQWPSLLASDRTTEAVKQRIRSLTEIQDADGKVLFVRADAADKQQMHHAVDLAQAQFGSIFGIIHAAGTPGVGMLQGKTRADALSVLSSKLHGTEWITELLHQNELGLVILCSSISSIVPSVGLTDYAAANAYLDAYAALHDSPEGTRVLAHNWDTWSNVGMAYDLAQKIASVDLREQVLAAGISDQEAAQVFPRLLACPLSQLIISTRNLEQLLMQTQTNVTDPDRGPRQATGNLHSRPTLSSEYTEASDETELALIAIWQDLLGIDRIGTADNFFQLGGHSLLGTLMMAKIRERFGIDLPLRVVFESPTPAEMASLIRAIPWASGVAPTAPTLDMEREEIEL